MFAGPADEATLARLEQALAEPAQSWSGFPWLEGRIGALAAERYLELADQHLDRVIGHVIASLAGKPEDVRLRARKLLTLLFPESLPPGESASAPAIPVLRTLLEKPGVVDQGFLGGLNAFGLLTTMPGLQDLAGLEVPGRKAIARSITVDGQTLPFHLAWLRSCWGRLSTEPARLVEAGFAGLSPGETIQSFHALVTLAGVQSPRVRLKLPVEPPGKKKEYPQAIEPVFEYVDDQSAVQRAEAFIDRMQRDGWEVVYPPLINGNFGSAVFARDGVEIDLDTNVAWVDGKPLGASTLSLRPKLSLPRLLAPPAYRAHGDALLPHVATLARRTDLKNMPKWWTLQLATLLAQLADEPPDLVVGELFQRCYVSWAPSSFRIPYLQVIPPDRAEKLALWLLSKQRGATWVAAIVPSERVKTKVAGLARGQ